MKKKIVNTSVVSPRARKIMEELNGEPVHEVYSHSDDTKPPATEYAVEFIEKS